MAAAVAAKGGGGGGGRHWAASTKHMMQVRQVRQGTTHTKDMRSKRDDARDAGQKRVRENRAVEEEGGGGEAAMRRRERRAPMENWERVSKSGPTAAWRNSCLVMIVAATLHTYLPQTVCIYTRDKRQVTGGSGGGEGGGEGEGHQTQT